MQQRPLRPWEQAAHLHVLDWAHDTARQRLQAAGQAQVKAGARAVAKAPDRPLTLPSLEAAVLHELTNLYAVGHATVRSELDHQARGARLPVGLSIAPAPPHLRAAEAAAGERCATCHMFDPRGVCWGYGNHPVLPGDVCDSWAPEPGARQLAVADVLPDPNTTLRARARLVAESVAHHISQAVHRGRLQGITQRRQLRSIGVDAGHVALGQAASHHAGGTINAGRHAAALRGEVLGARYTSVLDKNSCAACVAADDGVLRALDDPGLISPPNPACAGGDRCRCILVYQLASEGGAIAAGR